MSLPQRKRTRMEGFDYSSPGSYFITINANTRADWFGFVVKGLMHPNAAGKMVQSIWDLLPDQYPGTMVDAYVVMPDHVHGIIMLGTDPAIADIPKLSDVVGTFKSLATLAYGRGVRENGWPPFDKHLWHRSYRDTIIRSDRALEAFRSYVEGNPGRWADKHEP